MWVKELRCWTRTGEKPGRPMGGMFPGYSGKGSSWIYRATGNTDYLMELKQ